MAEAESNTNSEKRYVKGLLLADTLGKGTFGYVKLGVKESTGQQFALKFLMKNNRRFKMASVKTEIDCMKKINHPNVIRLLHADYNCKYPNQAGKLDDTVLMVMEYAPGGDLYDILFYSGKLNERITKTYFLQLAAGVDALHKAGITHRDLKANNILLDHKFRLKITDFGLSHVFEGEDIKANRMKTTWVGTRGYQAPELILNRPFSYKVDIFSMGVVIFTLLCKHQPFKSAAANDPWFKCIAAGKPKKFWNAHSNDKFTKECKSIIERMIAYQPKQRAEIPELLEHPWVQEGEEGPYNEEDLCKIMKNLHKTAVKKKMTDPKRLQRIEDSQVKNEEKRKHRDHDPEAVGFKEQISDLEIPKAPAVIPFMGCWLIQEPAKTIVDLRDMLEIEKHAQVQWFPEEYKIRATISFASDDGDFKCTVEFRIFQHPEKEGAYICHCSNEIGDVLAGENFLAFEEIWTLASKNFTDAYVPEYDASLFTYQEGVFEEEVAAAS